MLRFLRVLAVVVLSLMLVTALAACGGAGATTEEPAAESAAEATNAPAEVEEQTLTVSGAFALFSMMTVWGEQFSLANPNVRFDITGGGAGKGITDILFFFNSVCIEARVRMH